MKTWTKLILHGTDVPATTRTKLITLIVFAICLCGFAGTLHAAGKYLKIDYPASTDTNELQTPVTYTLWIPNGVKTIRDISVHQHGAGTTA
jgi:hypothetical protein